MTKIDGIVVGQAPRVKLYHMADKISPSGGMSALCFAVPRPINLKSASWTLRPTAVTCPKCKRILVDRAKSQSQQEGQKNGRD